MNPTELYETTLCPKNRTLFRITMEDAKQEVENFAILHGGAKDAAEERKKMISMFEIDIEDIDN